MRIRSVVAWLAFIAIAAGSPASAQAHPNFSGVWTLDAGKTVIEGQGAAPTAGSYAISHRGDTLTVDAEMTSEQAGTVKSHTIRGTDGKVWKNTLPVGGTDTEVSSILSWESGTLVVKSSLTVQEMAVEQLDRWTLSSDGKTLSVVRSITAMGQEMGSTTMFFAKKS